MTDEPVKSDEKQEQNEYIEGREPKFVPSCEICGSTDIRPFLQDTIALKRCEVCGTKLCPQCLRKVTEKAVVSGKTGLQCPNGHKLS